MLTVTVSDKGQVIRADVKRQVAPTRVEDGFGMLECARPGKRGLADFDVADALAWHAEGMDFADALHVQASGHCEQLLSFDDRRFARRAKKLGLKPEVVEPRS